MSSNVSELMERLESELCNSPASMNKDHLLQCRNLDPNKQARRDLVASKRINGLDKHPAIVQQQQQQFWFVTDCSCFFLIIILYLQLMFFNII